MPDLVTTAGSASANSFASSDECDLYCEGRLNASAWTGGSDDDKDAALIEATRDINGMLFTGRKATLTQALQWPRILAPNPDSGFAFQYFTSSEIPQRVKDATCELALQYLKLGTTDLAAYDTSLNVIEKTVDVLTTRYAEPFQRPKGLARFPRVLTYLQPLLASRSATSNVLRG